MKNYKLLKTLLVLIGILIGSVSTQMWGATIFNCGIDVNDTWYKGTGTINSGNWLQNKTAFNGANLGALTSMTLGGQYDTWDNNQTDQCSWNANNGIHILIKKGSTQITSFKLTCYHDSKSGNNNTWKTKGGIGSCSDSGSWGTYTVDISGYSAGNDYTIKATWTSPSSVSNNATANFTINPVVTFKANGGTGSDYTQRVTYDTNTALTTNTFTKTGYNFAGWATSADGNVVYTDGANVKLTAHTTLYAKWTAKTYSITLDGNGGSDGSATATYNSSTLTSFSGSSRASYDLNGYFTATSGGTKVINADGTLVANVSGYTNSSRQWIKDNDVELHAQWTYNPVTYSVTYAVGTGYTSFGSLSAKNTSTSAAIASGSSLESGTGVTFTATPNTGYEVEGWYTNAACTSGKHDAGSNTYSTTLSGNITVYVKFVEKTWSVAFAAGTGGSVTTPAATPQTVGQLTGINIAATPSTGYTFKQWTITSGSGSFTSAATTNSNKFKPTAASTITASFNETKSTITVTTATSSQGSLKFGSTAKSWGTTASLGVATKQNITATAASGYKFVRWDLSGAAATSSSTTSATITLKADGSGDTGTATAVFEEDLSSPWIVAGGNKIVTTGTTWRTTADANNTMLKKTGHSTESVVYFTVPVTTVCSGDNNENFQFKIYNTSTSKWYGLFASGSYYLLKAEDGTEKSLIEDNQNIELRAYVTGDYEFKLDYSTSTPKLTVTWPVYNQLRFYSARTGGTGTYTYDFNTTSTPWTKTVSLTAGSTYWFKVIENSEFFGNTGTMTRENCSNWTMSNVTENCGITPDFDGDYTFSYNPSTNLLTVTYPTAYTITYGAGTHNGSSTAISVSPLFNSGDYVLPETDVTFTKGSTKAGYTWKGWYSNAAGTGTLHSSTDGNWTSAANTRTANLSVFACYNKVNYTITYNLNGGTQQVSPAPATTYTVTDAVTLPTPTKSGYKFAGWYENEDLTTGGRKTNITAGTTGNKTYWAKWVELATFDVYFYNKDNWASPHAYIWNSVGDRHETTWPGGTMTTHQGKVYKYEYESADDYNKVQFNDGTSSHQYDNLSLPAYNQAFYNPEGAGTWTEYIMVAAFPTETITAVIGEKVTIEPIVAWAEGINFSDITITSVRASGPSDINAVVAGTKLMVSGTANGTAKFTVTYNYSSTTITKTLNVKIVDGITIQAKIAKNDSHWTYTNIVKMHYWGTGVADSDLTMTWMKADDTFNFYQASVPKGTDGKANFIFFYDYMENTDANRWRQTADITNVTSSRCYTISYAGNTNTKSNQSSVDGICSDSWQVQIVMGSGDIYTSNIVESSDDIVSFFAPGASESHSYRQGTVTLEHNGATVATLPANTFSSSGVYTAKVKTSTPYGLTDLAPYTGDYYIRTDGADGGWDNYKTNADNLMTEFTRNTNFPNETFSYYWVKNVAKNKTENIKATVANDYNPVLCNFTADETANATDGVNLRFGYEPTTNDIVRGIIGGATTNNFLNIICADGSQVYKEMACTTLLDETLYASSPGDSKFQDKSNWVYEVIVYAKIDASHPVANVVLKSYYNGINYLLGMVKDSYGRETSTPVSFPVIKTGTTPGVYGLRVVYDFKTNRLFAAWAPADRVIDGVLDVDADVMFLRHEDGDAAQISFKTTSSEIVDIKQAIFALELDNEKGSNIERHYFISLPFDCKVSNIFGIGGFMTYWGIQRYRGDLRAEKGWFQETPTFWEWLSADDVMQAGEGYLLSVDKKALQNDGVWKEGIVYQKQETIIDPATHKPYKAVDGTDSVAWVTYTDGSLLTMYFPSTTSGFTITPATGEALTLTYPDQPCSITRENRDKKDSNWKCIGTPGYKNITISDYSQSSPELVENAAPNFLYVFNEQTSGAQYAKGTYSVTNGRTFTYHSFNSYMVQFAGTVDWAQYSKGTEVSPIAPKRIVAAEEKTTDVQLNLMGADNNELDRTFVWMRENATIGFDQNYDLNKMIENKANQIYSLAENDIPFAANVLPLGTDTVKLVVNIAQNGEFIFSLEQDKHVGMAPVLYDMYKSEQINLLNSDYLVELEKGKYEDRFFLLFQPEAPIVTNFETTADGGQNVHSSEAIYDVLGRRVNTIYPGHLYIVNGEKRIAK